MGGESGVYTLFLIENHFFVINRSLHAAGLIFINVHSPLCAFMEYDDGLAKINFVCFQLTVLIGFNSNFHQRHLTVEFINVKFKKEKMR
jgi:hypothetical protein